jgi:hypothetical protein
VPASFSRRVDPRDLRRNVGAHAEQPARQRIDDLEGLQVESVRFRSSDSRCSTSGWTSR